MKKNLTFSVTFDYDVTVDFSEEELRELEEYLEENGNTIKQWVPSIGGLRVNPIYDMMYNKVDIEKDWIEASDIEDMYIEDVD